MIRCLPIYVFKKIDEMETVKKEMKENGYFIRKEKFVKGDKHIEFCIDKKELKQDLVNWEWLYDKKQR